jgi:hypothetical protein
MKKNDWQNNEIDEAVIEEAEIPQRFRTLAVEDWFGSKKALQKTLDYIENSDSSFDNGTGLFFRGAKGNGKTFLLSLALKGLSLQGFEIAYTTMHALTENLMRPERNEKFNVKFMEKQFVAVDCIDTSNEGTRAALRVFVTMRKDNALPFLLASPLASENGTDSFKLLFGEDIALDIGNHTETVNCTVDPAKLERYYLKLKEH